MLREKKYILLMLVFGMFSYTTIFGQNERQVDKGVSLGGKEKALYDSISSGRLNEVIALIVSGVDMDTQDQYGDSILVSAILNSQVEIAQYLITRGVNLEISNIDGNTAIIAATMMGDLGTLKILLNKGANPIIFNRSGEGLLEVAIKNKQYAILEFLLQNKIIFVDQVNPLQLTPLGYAALMKDIQATEILLSYKANPNIRSSEAARTPLMVAASQNDVEILTLLDKAGADRNILDAYDRTALAIAIAASQNKAAMYLLDRKANINTVDIYEQTPLTLAVANDLRDISKALIKRGANVNQKNIYGQTPLMVAASHGRLELLEFMLDKAAGNLNTVILRDFTEVIYDEPYTAETYKAGWNILDIAEEALQPNIVTYLIFKKGMEFNKYLDEEELSKIVRQNT